MTIEQHQELKIFNYMISRAIKALENKDMLKARMYLLIAAGDRKTLKQEYMPSNRCRSN